jgi:hypothetical protein
MEQGRAPHSRSANASNAFTEAIQESHYRRHSPVRFNVSRATARAAIRMSVAGRTFPQFKPQIVPRLEARLLRFRTPD